MSARRAAAALVASSLFVAACSGGDEGTTPAEPGGAEPGAPGDGAGVDGDTFVAAGEPAVEDGGEDGVAADASTSPPPAAPVGDAGRHPLTGAALSGTADPTRSVLAVVVDEAPGADGAQTGLDDADIVIETIVEGGATRLIALFHSTEPEQVGPVRSARTQDLDILSAFGTPIVASAGGNPGVMELLSGSSSIADVNWQDHPDAYDLTDAPAPHNLFADGASLRAAATGVAAGAPAPQFLFTGPNMEPAGTPVVGFDVTMGEALVSWTWDELTGAFSRSRRGAPHLLADGTRVSAQNVVVLGMFSRPSAVDERSPEVRSVGSANVYVFTEGKLLVGHWWRSGPTEPFRLVDFDGVPIPVVPGRTWIEVAHMDPAPGPGDPPMPVTVQVR